MEIVPLVILTVVGTPFLICGARMLLRHWRHERWERQIQSLARSLRSMERKARELAERRNQPHKRWRLEWRIAHITKDQEDMRKAKKPATLEQQQLASVVVDALQLDNRAAVETELATLVPVAISQYLRLFANSRNVTDRLWVCNPDPMTQENHFCCFFCRESLNTLPWRKYVTEQLEKSFVEHGEKCAMLFLADMITPVGPNGEKPSKRTMKPKKLTSPWPGVDKANP